MCWSIVWINILCIYNKIHNCAHSSLYVFTIVCVGRNRPTTRGRIAAAAMVTNNNDECDHKQINSPSTSNPTTMLSMDQQQQHERQPNTHKTNICDDKHAQLLWAVQTRAVLVTRIATDVRSRVRLVGGWGRNRGKDLSRCCLTRWGALRASPAYLYTSTNEMSVAKYMSSC